MDLKQQQQIFVGHYIDKVSFQNNDGKLTKDEFREGSKCDPYIVKALSAGIGGCAADAT